MKVAHFADVHFRGLSRHDEYRASFNDSFEKLKKLKPDVIYIGGDIVKDLVNENRRLWETNNVKFISHNICVDQFPRADLWICRDTLFHLSYEVTFNCYTVINQGNFREVRNKIGYCNTSCTSHGC